MCFTGDLVIDDDIEGELTMGEGRAGLFDKEEDTTFDIKVRNKAVSTSTKQRSARVSLGNTQVFNIIMSSMESYHSSPVNKSSQDIIVDFTHSKAP